MSVSSHPSSAASTLGAALALTLGLATAPAAAPGAEAAPRTGPCSSPACRIVSRADVDGDGRADTTTVTRGDRGRTHTVRVITASGRTARATLQTRWLPQGLAVFHGAAAVDGARGAELVLRTGAGAHTQVFQVLTWRQGRLTAEKDPNGSTEWVTDGALSSAVGYTARTVKGRRQLTSTSLSRDSWGPKATFSGTRIVARWQGGRWTPITKRRVVMKDSAAVWRGSGWNVTGLDRW